MGLLALTRGFPSLSHFSLFLQLFLVFLQRVYLSLSMQATSSLGNPVLPKRCVCVCVHIHVLVCACLCFASQSFLFACPRLYWEVKFLLGWIPADFQPGGEGSGP